MQISRSWNSEIVGGIGDCSSVAMDQDSIRLLQMRAPTSTQIYFDE
jgi:hypothetical protein